MRMSSKVVVMAKLEVVLSSQLHLKDELFQKIWWRHFLPKLIMILLKQANVAPAEILKKKKLVTFFLQKKHPINQSQTKIFFDEF